MVEIGGELMENQHFDPLEEYLSALSSEEVERFWADEERLRGLEDLGASACLEAYWRFNTQPVRHDYELGY